MNKFSITNESKLTIVEAHSGISALLIDRALRSAGTFPIHGIWISSLTETASRGIPDKEILGIETRLQLAEEIYHVTDLPIIFDLDTGGTADQLAHRIRKISMVGISAVVMEDKIFPKVNSFSLQAQGLEAAEVFAEKICIARSQRRSSDLVIIARIEALIVGQTVQEALDRAILYTEAGADAILIHSKSKTADQVVEFARRYRQTPNVLPLVCVPTTYNCTSDQELFEVGFNMVIHANHLLRASMQAMQDAIESIRTTGSTSALEKQIYPLNDLLSITE
ncbi:MAG: isocitrate lyase/phosphoenolpyruvate mutase family protein [Oligoflexales bacterium]|nr:isocitrate lyase/phosphoenolpyruvate mutase family protein [Oligoflexales bacterium]